MKTPVKELYEKLWEADKNRFAWNAILMEMLEKEKEVMCDFAFTARLDDYLTPDELFDKTFNTNEK
jgi:hypothetical protein